MRECGTSSSRDQAGVQMLSVADIAGKPRGDAGEHIPRAT
jgi:hypothetical protein